jgi:transcriptional regulator with XRE-family HTH domain
MKILILILFLTSNLLAIAPFEGEERWNFMLRTEEELKAKKPALNFIYVGYYIKKEREKQNITLEEMQSRTGLRLNALRQVDAGVMPYNQPHAFIEVASYMLGELGLLPQKTRYDDAIESLFKYYIAMGKLNHQEVVEDMVHLGLKLGKPCVFTPFTKISNKWSPPCCCKGSKCESNMED